MTEDYTHLAEQVGIDAEILEATDVVIGAGYTLPAAVRLVMAARHAGYAAVPFAQRFVELREVLRDLHAAEPVA